MKFSYQAKNGEGKIVEGVWDANSRDEAILSLRNKNMEIISLKEKKDSVKKFDINNIGAFFEKASLKDVVNISKQMSALLEAGVSVIKGLQLVADDMEKPLLKNAFKEIINDIRGGKSISQAFAKHPKIFDDFYVNLLKSGEESGKMAQAFSYLAEYMDRNYSLVTKVKNAMIYPIFVISVFLIVMILIFTLVIPKLSVILLESNVPLPVLTNIVLGISNFLVSYGIYILLAILAFGIYIFATFRDTNEWTEFFDTLKIKVPIVKNVYKMLYVTRIADNIQTLLASGVSLTKAISITADVVGNVHYKKILLNSLTDVKAGISFSASFAKSKDLIPNILTQMLRVGEETGEIAKLMGNIAKFYQRELNNTIDSLIGLIEPIMIVSLGLGVGLLLVSVLMPIYNLAGSF